MVKTPYKIRLKTGDTVIVRSGKYRGRTGKVLAVDHKLNRLVVEGINQAKRHVKPTREKPQGGIVEITRPLPVSKVAIYDSAAKKASRITYKLKTGGGKSRLIQTSGKELK